jgi:hypothetical protein
MPNVTIAVSEDLKTQMDKYSEVNWSEICRNSISQYIAQRENPQPRINLAKGQVNLASYDYQIGYASMTINVLILNHMNMPIIVDRILAKVITQTHDGQTINLGQITELNRITIDGIGTGYTNLRLALPREKLLECKGRFTKTFDLRVVCSAFVDGFKDPYMQEFSHQMPIDLWNTTIDEALERSQKYQAAQ